MGGMGARFGVVVLTMGTRPRELERGVESILAQRSVDVDIVVVGNGCEPTGVPAGVRTVALPDNVGATAGRNAGVPWVDGELLLFLDDDAALPAGDTLARIAHLFEDPAMGVVQPRVVDPEGLPTARRHVPRLRTGDPARSGDVTSFWEGAVVIRRSAFDEVGGFDEAFWYAHEGLDFGWRVMDAGYRVHYAGDVVANHPAPAKPPQRHYYLASRNRVWLARRHLPWPIAVLHCVVWFVLSLVMWHDVSATRDAVRGYRDGIRRSPGPRRTLRWRTIWRMTRIGRPPVI
jgi:GT2 family glycosyltransferase